MSRGGKEAAETGSSTRARNNLAPRLRQQDSPTAGTSSNINRSTNQTSDNGRLQATSRGEDELPADFYELPAEQLDLGMNATGRAPIPMLNVLILKDGQPIDNSIDIHPGTPLEMVIFLDDKSSKVYGLLVSHLRVQDNTERQREEIILQNGCSLDTYIFDNFRFTPEDQSLRARFKAFKFPESNFVRFEGIVNVCIKQCSPVSCTGSRRKRDITSSVNNKSQRLIMTVSTTLRIKDPIVEPISQRLR